MFSYPLPMSELEHLTAQSSVILLRRLRHDSDLAWFKLALGLAILIAAALALS